MWKKPLNLLENKTQIYEIGDFKSRMKKKKLLLLSNKERLERGIGGRLMIIMLKNYFFLYWLPNCPNKYCIGVYVPLKGKNEVILLTTYISINYII